MALVNPRYAERLAWHAMQLDSSGYDAAGPWKRLVRVATTANVTIATDLNAGDTIDGVVLSAGDRVLVKNQTTGSQNGIYIAGSTPARATDYDSSAEILGSFVFVLSGTVNGAKVYRNTNTAAITVDTTALTYAEFGGGTITVRDIDGTPSIAASAIEFTNGTVADQGSGVARVTISGGSLTVKEEDGTPNVASVTEIRVTNGTLTDQGAGAVSITTGGGGGGAPTGAKYVTTETDATLSAEIVIPGLAASPDIRVAGANDQEFDSSTIGGTALGAPTTIDANTTFKSHLYIKKSAVTGFSLQGRYWTTPSTPFTMTCKLTDWTQTKVSFMRVAMGIAESTPGKTEGIYIDGAGTNGQAFVSVISSTTPTTGAAYVQSGNSADFILHAPIYFRVVVASSTDITWYFSTGGLIWRRVAAANRNPGFTIGSYFLSAHPEQATYDMEAAFDWVRFT